MGSYLRLGSLLVGSAIAFSVSVSRANLVLDPGFESDAEGFTSAPDYLSGGDWQITQGTGYVADFAANAHSGNNYFEISPDGDLSTIQQDLTTQSGSDYDLSFYYASYVTDPMTIDFGGTSMSLTEGITNAWVPVSYTGLTATSASTALSFSTADESVFLDDISVTPSVPEPATLGLMAAVGIGIMARRRRNSLGQ
jgi:hypothetical protein